MWPGGSLRLLVRRCDLDLSSAGTGTREVARIAQLAASSLLGRQRRLGSVRDQAPFHLRQCCIEMQHERTGSRSRLKSCATARTRRHPAHNDCALLSAHGPSRKRHARMYRSLRDGIVPAICAHAPQHRHRKEATAAQSLICIIDSRRHLQPMPVPLEQTAVELPLAQINRARTRPCSQA